MKQEKIKELVMDLSFQVKVKNFSTPNFVLVEFVREDNRREQSSISIKRIDANALSLLCDEFRREVFEKAEKEDPRLK